jgi:hypothetical protein
MFLYVNIHRIVLLFHLFVVYDLFFIIIYLFPQEYFQKKNAEAMPTQRDLG